ncbi:glycosyltransferase family 4 protein [Candidatus Uhrbacteria bacterium]|nr:glycosyltransferase family 4 protein [Candidatus Uhrbacteria bacterium]
MRIGIDARMYGPEVGGGGLGRYVERLVDNLLKIDHENRYVLFVLEKSLNHKVVESESQSRGVGITKSSNDLLQDSITSRLQDYITTPIHWYTFKEQFFLAPLIDKQKLDLVHFPHWNVPIGLKTPFVVTIHDLILLEEPRSARATTKHPWIYALKYIGFKKVLEHAIQSSKKIIAVSQSTKNDILKHFPNVPEDKIKVIYEGITSLPKPKTQNLKPFHYILYVGNCYPHKNLETLLSAFSILHKQIPNLHLVIAGRNDVFFKRLKQKSNSLETASFVHFEENPSDEKLAELYDQAELYVFPSRIEGFGLPPLEAMERSTPVACSDIPSLSEILGEAAVYFPKDDPEKIANVISKVLNDEILKAELIKRGNEQVKGYSWDKMAIETVNIYNEIRIASSSDSSQ